MALKVIDVAVRMSIDPMSASPVVSVTVESVGVTDEGALWAQQAVVEGRFEWPLYDWVIAEGRDRLEDGSWSAWEPDGVSRPFSSQEARRVVVGALLVAMAGLDGAWQRFPLFPALQSDEPEA